MGKRLLLMALMAVVQVLAAELTEAKVFEWWDDGLIAPEEANEILSLMDEQRFRESMEEHREIVHALVTGDLAKADEVNHHHLELARQAILRRMRTEKNEK